MMIFIKNSIYATLILATFSAVAATENVSDQLIIQATPDAESTVVINGKPKYEKTFKVVVLNSTKKPIELTGAVGCYRAFDESGKSFDERLVEADLLGKLKDNALEGEVSFISDDNSVYNAKFVKWTTQCPNLTKRVK